MRHNWWSMQWQAVPGSGALALRATCSLFAFACHAHSGFLEVHVAAVLGAASASIPEPVVALPYFCRASTTSHNTRNKRPRNKPHSGQCISTGTHLRHRNDTLRFLDLQWPLPELPQLGVWPGEAASAITGQAPALL